MSVSLTQVPVGERMESQGEHRGILKSFAWPHQVSQPAQEHPGNTGRKRASGRRGQCSRRLFACQAALVRTPCQSHTMFCHQHIVKRKYALLLQ